MTARGLQREPDPGQRRPDARVVGDVAARHPAAR